MDTAFQVFFADFFGLIIALCALSLIAVIVGAIWMYRDAESRRMDGALWVVLLILATFIGTFVGFVIVLVVYLVVRESHPVGGGMPYGYGYGYPPPGVPSAAGVPPVPAPCPVCGGPMTWYPQYARWYCPACGQYR